LRKQHVALTLIGLIAVAAGAITFALAVGSVDLSVAEVWAGLTSNEDDLPRTLVAELRLPRALSAFAVGGLLAVAGALMQVLLRNPLADPYVLGVSGGAAVCALMALMMGLGGLFVDVAAFVGALGATLMVFMVSASGPAGWTPLRLLLTGVVMGDLSFAENPEGPLLLLFVTTIAGVLAARHLNIISRGDLQALSLGVSVKPLRVGVYLSSSLLTAVAVTTAGSIGFVGLVIPHLVRTFTGSDHRILLPAAALAGGSLLVIADTLARSLFAPRQLPVGALTAIIGVPLFLILIRRQRLPG
jgi:iron complex transport system permease protein